MVQSSEYRLVPTYHLPAHNMKALSYAVSACVCLAFGFYLGAHHGAKNVPQVAPLATTPQPKPEPEPEDSENEDEELADGDLSSVNPGMMEPCKLVSACQCSSEHLSR